MTKSRSDLKQTLITGVIGSDTHIVGNRILSMALEDAGYHVVTLGALTPAEDFIKAAIETAADAIMVSSLYGQGELDCRGFRDMRDLVVHEPDIVLLAGGTDGGNSEVILHNAEMLAAADLNCPFVVAGNRSAADEVEAVLGDAGREVRVVDNVMPDLGTLQIESARAAIRELFIERIVHAKGFDRAPADDPRWNTPESVGRSVREQAEILAQAGVDFFALEMCELIDFAIAATDAALEFDLPVWLGPSARRFPGCATLSVFDEEALDFESLVQRLAPYPAMMMNVMHTPVTDIDEALEIVRRYWRGPVGVYPESGYFTMPNWQFVDVIEPDQLVEMAHRWVDDGVRMVGGCCGLGPAHIAALREAFNP